MLITEGSICLISNPNGVLDKFSLPGRHNLNESIDKLMSPTDAIAVALAHSKEFADARTK
jgi:hypothetical protein